MSTDTTLVERSAGATDLSSPPSTKPSVVILAIGTFSAFSSSVEFSRTMLFSDLLPSFCFFLKEVFEMASSGAM